MTSWLFRLGVEYLCLRYAFWHLRFARSLFLGSREPDITKAFKHFMEDPID
jgi:hypothetical protein